MLQELLHWQSVRHVNRVPEVRGGDGTSTQPQSTAIAQGRKAQTYDPVRDNVRSQPGRKTTKRTAMARGHSNRKRGRQGHRHTKSITGCIRIGLSGLQGSANYRILEERGGGQKVNPVTRLVKCPRNSTLWEIWGRDTQESGKLTKWSPWIRAECRTGKY